MEWAIGFAAWFGMLWGIWDAEAKEVRWMTRERLESLIEIFCDADARAAMEPEELVNCPTVEEAEELMRDEN